MLHRKLPISYLAILITSWIIALAFFITVIVLAARSKNHIESNERERIFPPPKVQNLNYQFRRSAVASDIDVCADIGSYLMTYEKGNAIDAAIANMICHLSTNQKSCGFAGGAFMVFHKKSEDKAYAFDMRETAPAAANKTMFANSSESLIGGRSIATFGLVQSMHKIHTRFGRLQWSRLFDATIAILRSGWIVTDNYKRSINYFFSEQRTSKIFTPLREFLTNPSTNRPYNVGEIITDNLLANTLVKLQKDADALIKSPMLDNLVTEITAANGIITKQDLIDYKMKERQPVQINFADSKLFALPPPSSGSLIGLALQIFKNFKWQQKLPFNSTLDDATLFVQRLTETFKFVYAHRAEFGDEDFIDVKQLMANISSAAYAKELFSRISDDRTHPPEYYRRTIRPASVSITESTSNRMYSAVEDHGTSHLSVVAENGDAVSVTMSVNYLFGSLVRSSSTGLIFNDEMDDFSNPKDANVYGFPPSPNNYIQPGKRPQSSMSPVVITANAKETGPLLVAGAIGGSKIIYATALSAIMTQLFGQTAKQAVDMPRAYHQFLPDVIDYEQDFPKKVLEKLKDIGHKTQPTKWRASAALISRITEKKLLKSAKFDETKPLSGSWDPRGNGKCAGY